MTTPKAAKRRLKRDPKITTKNVIDKIGNALRGIASEKPESIEVTWDARAPEPSVTISYIGFPPPKDALEVDDVFAPEAEITLDFSEDGSFKTIFSVTTENGILSPDNTDKLLNHFGHILRQTGKAPEITPVYKSAKIALDAIAKTQQVRG